MKASDNITSRFLYPEGRPQRRMFALWYFGALIGLWTFAGHTILGFEQSWASPLAGVSTAIATTLILEWVRAWAAGEPPKFMSGRQNLASLLIPAWIPGLAVSMLLYPNERLAPIVFAAALSIASKALVRVPFQGGTQHTFNPSNFGITITLLLFPAVGVAPPYHFTENLTGAAHWLLPAGILASGILVHALFTGRLPLCIAWICGFVAQGIARSVFYDIPWNVPLMPMTSAAFILFTLYMIPDPATTPLETRKQIIFGLAVALTYGALISLHVVYGLFLALFVVCSARSLLLLVLGRVNRPSSSRQGRAPAPL